MVEDDDEVAKQLRVCCHTLVHSTQQPQRPALLCLELLGFLQLRDGQAPAAGSQEF